MNETSINFALVGRLVRRRWAVFLVLAIVGAVIGAALSLLLSPGYVSTAKVLLQSTSNDKEVPGEVQIATSLIVLDHTADDLGGGVTGTQLVRKVSAEIVDGNVLVISGAAGTPQAAQQLTDRVMANYVGFSTQILADAANESAGKIQKARTAIQQKISDANQRLTQIQASPVVTAPGTAGDQARAELQREQRIVGDATKQLEQLDTASDTAVLDATLKGASARIIQLATLPTALASPTLLQLVLGGAAGLALLAMLAHLILLRTDKRLRRAQDMAATFGASALVVVSGPTMAAAERSLMQRVLHDDRRWANPGLVVLDDERARDARYQRLLSRLQAGHRTGVVLAIVPVGDTVAVAALIELAVAAAAGPCPVALLTEDDALTRQTTAKAEERGVGSRLCAGPALPDEESGDNVITIQVARVFATQPTVPEVADADTALLLAEVGTRTSWEIAGISGACVDAGYPLLGLVAVVPIDTPRNDDGVTAFANGRSRTGTLDDAATTMAGSA